MNPKSKSKGKVQNAKGKARNRNIDQAKKGARLLPVCGRADHAFIEFGALTFAFCPLTGSSLEEYSLA